MVTWLGLILDARMLAWAFRFRVIFLYSEMNCIRFWSPTRFSLCSVYSYDYTIFHVQIFLSCLFTWSDKSAARSPPLPGLSFPCMKLWFFCEDFVWWVLLQLHSPNPARPLHPRIRCSRCHQIFLQRWTSSGEEHLRQVPPACLPRGDVIHWNVARRPEVILLLRPQLDPCTCRSGFLAHENDWVLQGALPNEGQGAEPRRVVWICVAPTHPLIIVSDVSYSLVTNIIC